MKTVKYGRGILLAMLIVCGCVEPYDPPLNNKDLNLLVVDGFLNATNDRATVRLSHTLPVKSTDAMPAESGALVWIEDDQGTAFVLTETTNGVYEGDVPGAGSHASYRLSIRTFSNREYVSEFVPVIATPSIDSITYSVNRDGVEFAVTTHDATGTSENYRWTFEETYEYNADFYSTYLFVGEDAVMRPSDEAIFTCWRTNRSTDLVIGSTKHLKSSIVSKHPVTFLPRNSVKISVEYSLLLRQQALTDEAYDYWLNLERTTEHLGGLFDPLPSEVQGNMRSVTNPSETVIGLFDAGTVTEQRIFVERNDLDRELIGAYRSGLACELDTIFIEELPQIYKPATYLVGAIYGTSGPFIIGYTSAVRACVDCTTAGGTTEKPPFWE